MLATFMSGLILMAVGLLRLGTFSKYIPFPVTVGFTAGIAVIIFSCRLIVAATSTMKAPAGPPI